jgi:hypothetical protein
MKNISAFRVPFLALTAALSWTVPLHAADPIETHWSDVCKVSAGNELVLTTLDGATADGYCVRVNVDEIAITTLDHRTIHVARATLASLQVRHSHAKGHQLKSLHKEIHEGLREELSWLLSPMAPLGLVAVPATLAWGAVAAPFCMLGDLVSKITPADQEIKLLADSAPAASATALPTKSNP